MLPIEVQQTLAVAIDTLLSTAPQRHAIAFQSLSSLLGQIVAESADQQHALLDAFLRLQEGFEHNLAAALLAWLGTAIWREQNGPSFHDQEASWTNVTHCLALLQGVLLLHTPSQRLFARRSAIEYLLTILNISRPSHPLSPAMLSSPSPIMLPPSPAQPTYSPTATQSPPNSPATMLSLATLDALLCALVDRPKNLRTFESVGGLAAVVKVLKDKTVAQVVRIKAIEILYFYLLPERPSTSEGTTPRGRPRTPPPLHHLAASTLDFVPQTPQKPARRPLTPDESPPRGSASAPLPSRRATSTQREAKPTSRRTEAEKRELLRAVMPNVEALEHRFKAMGLGT